MVKVSDPPETLPPPYGWEADRGLGEDGGEPNCADEVKLSWARVGAELVTARSHA